MKEQVKKRLEYVLGKLTPHGPITAKAMFGGYGIYNDGIIFSLLVGCQVYFRIDETNEKDYEPYGSEPFVYEGAKRPVALPYMTLPEEILENPNELSVWIDKATRTSLHRRKKKK